MKKIKISTIVLLTCLSLTFIFDATIPVYLGIIIGFLSLVMLVLLNIEMFKVKGAIKKLILYMDVIVGFFLILTFIPNGLIDYGVNNFLSHSLIFIFIGMLIVILINAYNIEVKK